jgi:uncharacterized membrane protein
MFSFPLTNFFVLVLAVLLGILIFLVEIKAITYAYEKAGISHRYVFAVLLVSLLGSAINIPIMRLGGTSFTIDRVVHHIGGTILAVNLGGAVVPVLLSLYLLSRSPELLPKAVAGVAIMTAALNAMAQPVSGIGIALPTLAPPLLAAAVALLLDRRAAPRLAYISGTLGTLIGADLLNLDTVAKLGAPVASIGGAGTFDGVFLTGLIAVLLA